MLDNLNSEQKKAVMCTEGPLLVLAGAGSGKTRVITRRIAYLIKEKNVDPYNILAITFTNKAAREMKERVGAILGGGTEGMIISTFHSACVRILRREITRLGFSRNFIIYDTSDSISILKAVIRELDLSEKQYEPKVLLSRFGALKDEMTGPDEYISSFAVNFYEKNIGAIYREYQKKLRENNALDFDDIIYHTVTILLGYRQVLDFYRERFRYILVDEYQDTNKLQFRLIDLLAGERRNLCVVGDDDQSIFMWRGANIENIMSFEENFSGASVVKLEQNYRSTENILGAANDVIRHNWGRKEKKLWTDKAGGDKIRVSRLQNEFFEGKYIAGEIKRLVGDGKYGYSDIAVLYRMNVQSRSIEDAFMAAAVPYRVFGGLEFYKRKEVRDVLSYLKLIYNRYDSVAFERAVSVPKRGIGEGTVSKIREISSNKGISLLDAAADPDAAAFGAAQKKSLAAFAGMIEGLTKDAESMLPSGLIGEVIVRTGIIEEYMRCEPLEHKTREDNIRELVSIALQHEGNGITTLSEFLETVSLVSENEISEDTGKYVSLMTMHSAKGLEFPVVFICGFEEGIFPSEKSAADNKELEEERRLCYVGMTRAMELLCLTCTERRTLFGKSRYSAASRFLFNISEERLDYGTAAPEAARTPSSYGAAVSGRFSAGDRVIHKRFGIGKVTGIEESEGDIIIEIDFEDRGRRRLIEAYANLEKM